MARILFTSWYTGLGGGETDLLTLADSLDAERFECQLLLPTEGQLATRWRTGGRRCHIVPFRGASSFFLPVIWARFPVVNRLERLLVREGIDLIHCDYHSLPLVAPAARRAGIAVMWTVHGWWFKPKPWQRAFFRGIRAAARSQAIRAGFLGSPPFMPADRLPVIYSGIDTERFQPGISAGSLRREIGISDDAPVVAMVARFQPVKGQRRFLDMAERILEELPGTQFLVAGDDAFGVAADQAYRAEIHRRARASASLRDRVHFLGFRADVERVYAAADVFVCPSDFESFGKANLEAMACGKPVVSTRRGGPSETIDAGASGFLVECDAEALAESALTLLRNRELRAHMGAAGRARVESKFSAAASAAAYADFFEELLRLS